MKFSASFADQGSVETFSKCVQAMSRMSKKKLIMRMSEVGICLITCPATGIAQKDGIEYWLGTLFQWLPTFQKVAFEGLSEEQNLIVIEVDAHDLAHCLSGNHANTKLRLSNRNGSPHLRIDIRSHNITHELPAAVISSKKWESFDRPNCNGPKAVVSLPPSRTLLRVLSSMKNINCKFVTAKISNNGELLLSTATNNGEITVQFSDLVNDPIEYEEDEGIDEPTWSQAKLHVKPVQHFFSQFLFSHGKVKLTILNERAAEFSCIQDDFEVSFVLGDTSD